MTKDWTAQQPLILNMSRQPSSIAKASVENQYSIGNKIKEEESTTEEARDADEGQDFHFEMVNIASFFLYMQITKPPTKLWL